MFDAFKRATSGSLGINCISHEKDSYPKVASCIRDFDEPFVAELSLPAAAMLVGESEGSTSGFIILGLLTAFRPGHEITDLFYPKGRLRDVEYLDGADTTSGGTWLALMYLKTAGAAITSDVSKLRSRLDTSEEKLVYARVLQALRAKTVSPTKAVLAAGYPKEYKELLALAKAFFERVDLFEWYRKN